MDSQWMPREQLAALQTERMKIIVEHAYRNVPLYRKLYHSAGVTPSIRNIASITNYPIVTKETFRCVPLDERTASGMDLSSCRPISTSGSTGATVTVLEDPQSVAVAQALKLRFMWEYGVRPLDKICKVWYDAGPTAAIDGNVPRPRFLATLRNQGVWGYVRRRGIKEFPVSTHIDDHLAFMLKWKPDVLLSPASYCRALIRLCELTGKSPTFKLVITGGEMLDKSTRMRIGDKFHAKVFDHYGANDVGGTIAWECPTHSGYHINAEFLFLEFLQDGVPVKSGDAGEVHITCFNSTATPIIRYSVDDLAIPIDDPCSCGRGLPLIRDIEGRKVDFILTYDGKYITPYAVIGVMDDTPEVEQYKVLQRRDYSIEVSVRTNSEEVDTVLRDVELRCRRLFGKMSLDVKPMRSVRQTIGQKSRLVESQVAG